MLTGQITFWVVVTCSTSHISFIPRHSCLHLDELWKENMQIRNETQHFNSILSSLGLFMSCSMSVMWFPVCHLILPFVLSLVNHLFIVHRCLFSCHYSVYLSSHVCHMSWSNFVTCNLCWVSSCICFEFHIMFNFVIEIKLHLGSQTFHEWIPFVFIWVCDHSLKISK